MRMHRFALAALVSVFAAAGCNDTTGEDDDRTGTLSFTYRGPINGSFSADGELMFLPGAFFQQEGAAGAVRQDSVLAVVAARAASDTTLDVFTLAVGGAEGTGTYAFDPAACQQQRRAACRIGAFAPGLDPLKLSGSPNLPGLADQAYILVFGNVRITRISGRRVRGEFSGSAVRASDPLRALTISDGRFDVPIDESGSFGGSTPRGVRVMN